MGLSQRESGPIMFRCECEDIKVASIPCDVLQYCTPRAYIKVSPVPKSQLDNSRVPLKDISKAIGRPYGKPLQISEWCPLLLRLSTLHSSCQSPKLSLPFPLPPPKAFASALLCFDASVFTSLCINQRCFLSRTSKTRHSHPLRPISCYAPTRPTSTWSFHSEHTSFEERVPPIASPCAPRPAHGRQ